MAQDQLDEIRQKTDIVELISRYVSLKKAGRNFKTPCPFHSETQASFIVSPERQIFKCFGCGVGGDIFKFQMEIEGMEFGEALRVLAKSAGVKLRTYKRSEGKDDNQRLFEANHLASEFYHYLLTKHRVGKKALDYILGRGVSRESIEVFNLGFSPQMWDGLQRFLVKKKGYAQADLERAGLIIKRGRGGFYDRFRGRLMFPLRNHQGNVCGFAGRILEKDEKQAKYINSPETPVYHKSQLLYGFWLTRQEIRKADGIVLVEGELDMISSFQVGVKNVSAIKGSALTEDQLRLLKRVTNNLVLALDADVAGDKAIRRGIELTDSLGFSIKVVQIKGGKDPDEVARKDPALWRKLVSEAVPVYDYLFDSAFNRFDVQTAEGKRQIGRELTSVIAKITDSIVQGHYIGQLTSRLGVSEEAIVREVEKFSDSTSKTTLPVKPSFDLVRKTSKEILEEYFLALCLQSKEWKVLARKKTRSLIDNPAFLTIAGETEKYLKKYKTLKAERLAEAIPAELVEIFNRLYLFDLGDFFEDAQKVEKEIGKTIERLEEMKIRAKLIKLAREVKVLKKEKGSKAKLIELNREFNELSAKLT